MEPLLLHFVLEIKVYYFNWESVKGKCKISFLLLNWYIWWPVSAGFPNSFLSQLAMFQQAHPPNITKTLCNSCKLILYLYCDPIFPVQLLHQRTARVDPFWQYLYSHLEINETLFSLHSYSFSLSLESGILLILQTQRPSNQA